MSLNLLKISLFIALVIATVFFMFLDFDIYKSIENIKSQYQNYLLFYQKNTFLTFFIFGLVYIIITSLSLPIAGGLTLIGGALFGFLNGLIIVSFSSSIGATLAFLMARFIAHDYVKNNYKSQLSKFYSGFQKEGVYYLFALRMTPLFPFFLVNNLSALMPMKIWTFYWVSQLGMLPATSLYVYAGTKLSEIKTMTDIMSPSLIILFIVIGVFPIFFKKIFKYLRHKE